jgi:diphthamide synthase (EF-2-diphthine--ammonia ligase)
VLDPSFAGREFGAKLLDDLPQRVDPCGENGEYHTVVVAGPMFAGAIPVAVGPVVEREGFVFADVTPLAASDDRA